ncbi:MULTISPECIES: BspA family leucine-rich repeat surface protein [Gordonibacter]|uniref:BspA family leucine-rich repeat surface protein n=1 Tax=Gordonibacter faecis TaxID=3047475 RepID=A0ABT7DT11_9ACTN|nr:BspA family leucine-rich repeat surface protein [Gordonibacter sp. KGMB12511]MDJ1651738.1 BspA family leucine-rich repeat surface protein [Gordonibacter sp. KGMB12511]HIW75726.1 DUF285 domain-containing protein [Candidatus Gordonibacter avicola]
MSDSETYPSSFEKTKDASRTAAVGVSSSVAAPTRKRRFARRVRILAATTLLLISLVAAGTLSFLKTATDPLTNAFVFGAGIYQMSFDANGGDASSVPPAQKRIVKSETTTFTIPDTYADPRTLPQKENSVFLGWAETAQATQAAYRPGDSVTLALANPKKTLYAVWGTEATLIQGEKLNSAIKGIAADSSKTFGIGPSILRAERAKAESTGDHYKVTTVIFDTYKNRKEDVKDVPTDDIVDVSADQNHSVNLYHKNNGDDTFTAYILSTGTIFTNADSTSLFAYLENLTSVTLSNFTTSRTTTLKKMFYQCSALKSLTLTKTAVPGLDTSQVVDMSNMFAHCFKLATVNLSGFDTSNVTDMHGMFDSCSPLANLDLSGFDTSSVKNMSMMFNFCVSLSTLDVTHFDTSSVTNMSYMFQGCKFTALNLSNFNTSNVTNMSYLFNSCSNLATIYAGAGWNTDGVSSSSSMFGTCRVLKGVAGTTWSSDKPTDKTYARIDGKGGQPGYLTGGLLVTGEALNVAIKGGASSSESTDTSVTSVTFGTSAKYGDTVKGLNSVDVSEAHDGSVLLYRKLEGANYKVYILSTDKIYANPNCAKAFYNLNSVTRFDFSNFDTSNVTTMEALFTSCFTLSTLDLSSFNTSNVTNMNSMFSSCNVLTTLNLSSFNTSSVTNMQAMFNNCNALTTLNLSNFDTSNVTTMFKMFHICSALTALNLSNFDTSNVIDMRSMFESCGALTELKISNFKTPKVASMDHMFANCKQLRTLDLSQFANSSVTNMSYMFYNCNALTALNLSGFNTPSVTSMEAMFNSCGSLTTLNLSSFNTSSVLNMSSMFGGCSALTTLNVSSFNTSNVTTMQAMFSKCSALTGLDVSKFDTSNVTTMYYMFNACEALTTLNVSNFNTSKVSDMRFMFSGCKKLTTLDLSHFNTSSVKRMDYMFFICPVLKTLNLSGFNTSNVVDMSFMFYRCPALTTLDLSSFNTSNVTSMSSMFLDCSKLVTIYAGAEWSTKGVTSTTSASMFGNCQALVGGKKTAFATAGVTDATYARIDNPPSAPGYLTGIAKEFVAEAEVAEEGVADEGEEENALATDASEPIDLQDTGKPFVQKSALVPIAFFQGVSAHGA